MEDYEAFLLSINMTTLVYSDTYIEYTYYIFGIYLLHLKQIIYFTLFLFLIYVRFYYDLTKKDTKYFLFTTIKDILNSHIK